ncbi:MAG: AAA family ATPase, partial [Sulfolobales archaeon]
KLLEVQSNIKELEENIKELEENIKEETKILQAIKKLEKLRELLGENSLQAYLISATKRIIENNLNEILSKFDLSISRAEIDVQNKYQINAIMNSGERLSVNLLSGGEKVALSLALRMSIARAILSEIGFIIMDEPTVHLDEYRKQELLNIIRLSSQVIPQIIIVSHDQEVVNVADYVIRVEKKGEGSVVEVEK